MSEEISWSAEDMLEVTIKQPDDFLKVRETLTRIGVASKKSETLFQSCHILHKQGKYYIVHFKELFALDGKPTNIDENDIGRRNTICNLLQQWSLIKVLDNATNNDYRRRGIISKGAILETKEGKCKIVSKPGQTGIANAVLLKE